MSSYIVEAETINKVVSFIMGAPDCYPHYGSEYREVLEGKEYPTSREWAQVTNAEKLGQAMYEMNAAATAYRYDEEPETGGYEYRDLGWGYDSPIGILKALACYLYQCSEGAVPERPLFKALDAIRYQMAYSIVSELPEYDQAKWG